MSSSSLAIDLVTTGLTPGLRLSTADGDVLVGMKLRIRLPQRTLAGSLALAETTADRDDAGAFTRTRWRFVPDSNDGERVDATLELRQYASQIVAYIDYDGPSLAPDRGLELAFVLEQFARGLAFKRIKLFWLAPSVVSDPRQLSPQNVLLLWRRVDDPAWHALVPLAGDGMIGELGHEGFELRIALGSRAAGHAPRRVPAFSYATGDDPYRLPSAAYGAAWSGAGYWGKLREDKAFPECLRGLGWCSWNTYYHAVTEDKVVASARSLAERGVPVQMMLLDDGWLSVRDRKLTGFDADPAKFPTGLAGLARTLREDMGIRRLGIWHAFQGYWAGVDREAAIGRDYPMFAGIDGQTLPDPRGGAGRTFYDAWYAQLRAHGFDFVKVDNQAGNARLTDGYLPLFESGGGTQRNLQDAAAEQRLDVLSCMAMSLESALNWRHSAIARNSDDYIPDDAKVTSEHLLQNAYNALWTSVFAWPDWDMFQTHDRDADAHVIARAISGGPIYFTDEPGRERAELLRPLCDRDGQLYMLDAPGMVTRDLLLLDPSLAGVPLKVAGRITRPGLEAGMLAAFHVDKSADRVTGSLHPGDVEGLGGEHFVVWRRGGSALTLLARDSRLPVELARGEVALFTIVRVDTGVAVLGLLDKYLGPAAVREVTRASSSVTIELAEAGELAVWVEGELDSVKLDGVATSAWRVDGGFVRVQVPDGTRTVQIAHR
jgi:raffinose synthase